MSTVTLEAGGWIDVEVAATCSEAVIIETVWTVQGAASGRDGRVEDGLALAARWAPPWVVSCGATGTSETRVTRFYAADDARSGRRTFHFLATAKDPGFEPQSFDIVIDVVPTTGTNGFGLDVPVQVLQPADTDRLLIPIVTPRTGYDGEIALDFYAVEGFFAPGAAYLDGNPIAADSTEAVLTIRNPLRGDGEPVNGPLPRTLIVHAFGGGTARTKFVRIGP